MKINELSIQSCLPVLRAIYFYVGGGGGVIEIDQTTIMEKRKSNCIKLKMSLCD